MRIRSFRFLLAACLGAALAFAGAGTAFAAETYAGNAALRRLSAVPRLSALGTGPQLLSVPKIVEELPMGGRVKGITPAGGYHEYRLPLNTGQRLHVEITFPQPRDQYELDIYDTHNQDPIAYSWGAYPEKVDIVSEAYTENGKTYRGQWYDIVVWGPEKFAGSFTLTYSIPDPTVTAPIQRKAGATRFNTSASVGLWAFPATDTVVVATGRNYADALAASALCGSYHAPLLLTEPASLPLDIRSAITTLHAKRAFIIGGTAAVSGNVASQLRSLIGTDPVRIEGGDRFTTAAKIATAVKEHEKAVGNPAPTEAFVVSGRNFADALAVAPYAYSARVPILLSEPTWLPLVTSRAFGALGTTSVHVVGGAGSAAKPVVSDHAYYEIPVATKDRIAGADRADTSVQAATYAVGRGWAKWDQMGVATGWDYPDALSGGVAMGAKQGVLLLSKGLYAEDYTNTAARNHKSSITQTTMFGSTSVLSGTVCGDLDFFLTH